MALVGLFSGLLQLTREGPLRTGTAVKSVLDGIAATTVLAGIVLFHRWGRSSDGGGKDTASGGE